MMAPTPQRILDYLKTHPQASAYELSRVFSQTPVNIRHHLNGLLNSGWIELAGEPVSRGRGRPTLYFRLSAKSQKDNYACLANALLEQFLVGISPEEVHDRLKGLSSQLLSTSGIQASRNLTNNLNHLIKLLNDMSYDARWEARSSGPVIYFGHCPYASLLRNFPSQLCQLDRLLIEGFLGVQARPLKTCSFAIVSSPVN